MKTALERGQWEPRESKASQTEIEQLETLVGVTLPKAYRRFISTIGPGHLDACMTATCPTPFGYHWINSINPLHKVCSVLDSAIVPRNMICVGGGHFGKFTCLSICGLDRGAVYCLDSEMNYFKTLDSPQQFNRDCPRAQEFYRLLDAGELPRKPWGYKNCYHLADSFDGFISALEPCD